MTEREFLEAIRLRINQSNDLASLGYCDILEAKRYFLGPPEPRIEGTIYFVGDRTAQLGFSLLLPQDSDSLEGIVWDTLLPSEGSSGWALVDGNKVTIEVHSRGALLNRQDD